MAIDLHQRIAAQFPRLYHYSSAVNRSQIERLGAVLSADFIRTLAIPPPPRGRRMVGTPVPTQLGDFTLNDQAALNYGHVKHPESLSEADFADLLDQFAFFWPGSVQDPIEMGSNFANRYLSGGRSLLRISFPTESFFRINNAARIFLSICNSGAPRSNPNAVIYRGPDTFTPLAEFSDSVKTIKEIAVMGFARLPPFEITDLTGSAE